MGVRPPAFTFAAVRAMAPVARNAAEEHRRDVADALGHQLVVGTVVGADHGVGHHAGQKRLDGGQNGDGGAVGQLVAEQREAELGQVELGQAAVDGVEVADGEHIQAEAAHERDAREQRHERAGNPRHQARPQEQHGQADKAHDAGLGVHRGDVAGQRRHLVHGLHRRGAGGIGQAEEVLQLADGKRDGNARREARGDGEGHEADDGAQLEQAHEDEQDAGDDGGRDEAVHAVGGHDARYDGGEGRRGAEICTRLPPRNAMRKPATMAV